MTARRWLNWPLLFVIGAFAMRLIWVLATGRFIAIPTENQRVAASLAEHGTFADAYGFGTGATAHVGLLTPQIAAAIYALFGVGTPIAEFLLSAIAIFLVCLSFWLAWRCFEEAGAPRLAGLIALAIVCFLPIQFSLEAVELRAGEQPIAACMLLGLLLAVLKIDGRAQLPTARDLVLLGLLTAISFLISPSVGLGAAAMFTLVFLRRGAWKPLFLVGGTAALTVALVGAAWAVRNEHAIGAPIWLRSNMGLELALANHDAAVAPRDPKKVYIDRLYEIHPSVNMAPLKAAGGEVPYSRKLMEQTKAWIAAHPDRFLRLVGQHAVEFYLPPRWFWGTFGGSAAGIPIPVRQAMLVGAGLLGLLAIPFLAWRNRKYRYVALALVLPALPYLITQPILRYRYLISTLLIFMAVDALVRLWFYLRARSAAAPATTPA
ncbi:hypothetical protein [Sphingomonas sp. TDK1]|uniref:hypothetical protein n=1 Tax=Sphingomonas sp. TDK1 TaxID=453247 RepID=UPI0007D9985E|nr:hypothetical protein [Sphingomonas sp. TDK1]OAN67158.1 hypothetical protein A7X12_00585 [Sphingomonas sp. TDK1]